MPSGPSTLAETIVALFVPPAHREEVLGDLHERFKSPSQYARDALSTIPLVIVSRMRRTADPQILLIQAFALYASFLTGASLDDRAILHQPLGLMRLAIPAAMVLLGLILDDVYAHPGRRSPLKLAQGPVIGLGIALASQAMLQIARPDLALSRFAVLYGCAMSLLLSSAVRIFFPPVTEQLQGVNAPALWLKQDRPPRGRSLQIIVTIAVSLSLGSILIMFPSARPSLGPVIFFTIIVYRIRISKRR